MALELRQLLEKVSELDITPIAGQAGLERRVRWVHMVENEDSTTFLEGQDIAVITGIGLGESLTLMNLIRTLRDSHASGVIVNLGPYIQQIPQDVIEYSRFMSVPSIFPCHPMIFHFWNPHPCTCRLPWNNYYTRTMQSSPTTM